MDEKKLLTNLDKVISQLQSIAVNLGVSTGVDKSGGKAKVRTSLTSEEKAKIRAEAEEKSKIYKKTLGLGFNKEDTEKKGRIYADSISSSFKDTLPDLFSNIEIESDFSSEIVNELQILNSSVVDALVNGLQNVPKGNATYDQSIIDKTANRFRIMLGIGPNTIKEMKGELTSIYKTLDAIKTKYSTESIKHKFSTNYLKEIRNTMKDVKDFFKSDLKDYFSRNEQSFGKLNNSVSDMTYYSQRLLINSDQDQAKKAEKGGADGGIFSKLKNVAGLMLLGTGVFLIVQALVSSGSIDIGQTLKVIGVITAFSLLFVLLNKKSDDIRKGAISVGLLAAAMFVVIPVLYLFKDMPFQDFLNGLGKFSLVMVALLGAMYIMGKISPSDVGKSVLGIAALSLVMGFLVIPLLETLATMPWETFSKGITMMGITLGVMLGTMYILGKVATNGIALIAGLAALLGMTLLLNYFVETLTKFAYRPWEAITDGLTYAGISLVAFGAVVAAIGALVSTGAGAIIAVAGMAAVLGLVFVMDKLADSLVKYNNVDGDKLSSVGNGLKDLGIGLIALLGGSVAGVGASIVNGLSSLFGLDPVAQIQKFEKVDSEKIYKLGLGLKFMGEGLKAISTDVNLKPFVAELLGVTKPLTEFSGALDTFNKTYADFEKMTMNSEFKQVYQNKIESDKSIQEAIKNLNEQELSIQQMQLEQLQQNGELLRMIAEKTGSGGGGTQVVNSSNSGTKVSVPGFGTKTKYFNNLKLASMSINS